LVAIDALVTVKDVRVSRIDFPYRIAGRRAPDRPPVLLQTVTGAAAALAAELGVAPELIALGGRSMGGRIASMAVAEGLKAAALVLISYPLHPPGRKDQLRTAHLPQIGVPCLFVSGSRDAFATPDELDAATRLIPAPVTLKILDGGNHGLASHNDEVAKIVADWLIA
jgi:predicted alpha/beta-hydrolase family hydrolase